MSLWIWNLEISAVTLEIPEIRSLLAPPASRGSDPYTQFVSKLKRRSAVIHDQHLRRIFHACTRHLEVRKKFRRKNRPQIPSLFQIFTTLEFQWDCWSTTWYETSRCLCHCLLWNSSNLNQYKLHKHSDKYVYKSTNVRIVDSGLSYRELLMLSYSKRYHHYGSASSNMSWYNYQRHIGMLPFCQVRNTSSANGN